MSEIIQNNKFVELTYEVTDQKSGHVLRTVDFPLGYIHGQNEVLGSNVTKELEGKSAGDIIKVPVDCKELYGERDETLVFTDHIENVPEEYREIGMTIITENEKGEPRNFIVTRMDEKTLTVDGNNPLCGREVYFMLKILSIRDATDEEIEAGGKIVAEPEINIDNVRKVPVN
jgi:FKBP-type peptidyl-prolyl cis-trans isomerase SlyD